jgi:hypothetical protein
MFYAVSASTVKMEAARSSETLIPIYQTTRNHIPKEHSLNIVYGKPQVSYIDPLWRCSMQYLLLPWRWRQHVPPKRWYLSTKLHGITSQKSIVLISFTARASSFIQWSSVEMLYAVSASTVKMEAADSPQTFVPIYQTARRHIPEDCDCKAVRVSAADGRTVTGQVWCVKSRRLGDWGGGRTQI